MPGIYKIEKNRLMIIVCPGKAGKIPAATVGFSTRDGDGVHFLVLGVSARRDRSISPNDRALAYEVVRRDYDRASRSTSRTTRSAGTKQPKPEDLFAAACLKLAQEKPGTREEVFALCWAVANAPASEPGKKALAILDGGGLARADSVDLSQALETSKSRSFLPETSGGPPPSTLAPLVLRRSCLKAGRPCSAEAADLGLPEHSRRWVPRGSSGVHPGGGFFYGPCSATIAPRSWFCDNLEQSARRNPPWAPGTSVISARSSTRKPRSMGPCTSSAGLHHGAAGAIRQDEAVKLYESFIQQFQHPSDPRTRDAQADRVRQAREELQKIRDHQRGQPASAPGTAR